MQFLDPKTYPARIPQLETLFQRSFHKPLTSGFLGWRYSDNPQGEILACVETDGDRVIANYSASPCVLRLDGQEFKTALSMTTMTDPDFAGRGLFTLLARGLYEHMQKLGFSMIWGFPNRNSHYAFVAKLGWQDVYEIPTMRLNLASVPAKGPQPEAAREDNEFSLDYPAVGAPAGLLHVKKTAPYLKWRYLRNPVNRYTNLVLESGGKVSGHCVVKSYEGGLDVVDFQCHDPAGVKALLGKVVRYARDNQFTDINCWAPRHHPLHAECEKSGFVNREPITYLGALPLGEGNPLASVASQYSRWYPQMGDSDVY